MNIKKKICFDKFQFSSSIGRQLGGWRRERRQAVSHEEAAHRQRTPATICPDSSLSWEPRRQREEVRTWNLEYRERIWQLVSRSLCEYYQYWFGYLPVHRQFYPDVSPRAAFILWMLYTLRWLFWRIFLLFHRIDFFYVQILFFLKTQFVWFLKKSVFPTIILTNETG